MPYALRVTTLAFSMAIGAFAMDAAAARPTVTGTSRATAQTASAAPATALSPKARGEMTRQFVLRWGGYVQRVYRVPVGVWSKRMVPTFASVDGANFRDALARNTFEGAMAALSGSGHRLDDEAVITKLAMSRGKAQPVLGAAAADLVYTPVQPCRIADTRNTADGPIAAGSSRDFVAVNQPNYTAQGGSATDCGLLGVTAAAVAVNLTAVAPDRPGYATAYPFGTARPLAASVNYGAGQFVNNGIIVQVPSPLTTSDFSLYSYGEAHYVVDVVGYFAAPQATALDCTGTFASQNVAANDIFDIELPGCAAGYRLTGAGCRTAGFDEASWGINGLFRTSASAPLGAYCSGKNNTNGTITVQGTAQCCRVPGR